MSAGNGTPELLTLDFIDQYGVSIERPLIDNSPVELMQEELVEKFGNSVVPFINPVEDNVLILLGKAETARALFMTRDNRNGNIGSAILKRALARNIPRPFKAPMVSTSRAASVERRGRHSSEGIVSAFIRDERNERTRRLAVNVTGKVTGTPLVSSQRGYVKASLLPIARVLDADVALDIQKYRFKKEIELSFGEMIIDLQ